ncbi:MAG: PAS domain S-box protein, partial [Sphingobacteriales bacterium]
MFRWENTMERKGLFFLDGGGDMSRLIRDFNWSATSIGTPETWPQSLRITLSNLLRSKFPTILWWGDNMIQFYNDACCSALMANAKHPQALGQDAHTCWEGAWEFIFPLIHEVKTTGNATWHKNQRLKVKRDGFPAEVYWTFSFSSVLDDDGKHGGILVTCIETTEEIASKKQLEENRARLQFALEAGQLGEWELNLATYELYASAICKINFGQPVDHPFTYESLRQSIHPDDREYQQKEMSEIVNARKDLNIEYRVIWPDGSTHWINIRARVRYDEQGLPERIVGISIDITDRKKNEEKLRQSEERFRTMVEQLPVPMVLTRGRDVVIEGINEPMMKFMGKTSMQEVLGKKMLEVLPELREQRALEIVKGVQSSGAAFYGDEQPVDLYVDGVVQRHYFNLSYTPVMAGDTVSGVLHVAIDVTDQVTSRQRVEESEKQFRLMADSLSEMIWVADASGKNIFMNKRYEEYTGKVFQPCMAEQIAKEVVHPDDRERLMNAFNTSLSTGNPMEVEQRNRSASGEYRWFLNRAIPYSDPGTNEIKQWFGSGVDIHEHKIAQQALIESENRFRLMAEGTPVLIAVADDKAEGIYFNKAWTKLTGKSLQELLGSGWLAFVHPDDRPPYMERYMHAFKKQIAFTGDFRILGSEGNYHWLSADCVPRFDAADQFAGYISACTDITGKKKDEQLLQRALEQVRLSKEAAELGTFDLDLEKGTMHWDDRCRILFGISHHSTVTYEVDFVQGLHPEDRSRILRVIDNSFIKPKSNGDYDVEYRTVGAEDGVIRWVRAKGKVYFNDHDQPVRFIGSVLDITQKVLAIQKIEDLVEERTGQLAHANNELRQANTELQRSNANLEEFAHAASHDLKEPIRKIQVFTGQLKSQLQPLLQDKDTLTFNRIE